MQRFERLRRGVLWSKIGAVRAQTPSMYEHGKRSHGFVPADRETRIKPRLEVCRPANLPAAGKFGGADSA